MGPLRFLNTRRQKPGGRRPQPPLERAAGAALTDVFISYAAADRVRAEHLAHALEGRGFDVAWDLDLLPREGRAARRHALATEAKALAAIWSAAALEDQTVRADAIAAAARGVLVQARVENVASPVADTPTHDLSSWPGHHDGDEAFERVALAIERLRGETSAVTPAAPERADLRRRRRTAGIVGSAIVIIALLGYAATEYGPRLLAPREAPAPEKAAGEGEAPGADALYGFATEEIGALGPHELIATALQYTTIDVIERDARSGDRLGQVLLCLSRAYGEGLPKNTFIARQTCQAAADAGDPLALYQLSLFQRAGEGGFEESARAADRMRLEAANAGDPRAQTDIARGHLAAGRNTEAFTLLSSAAERGYRAAQVDLAALYERGEGVAKDEQAALRWYERAAEAGDAAALRALGIYTQAGKGGLDPDLPRAREHFRAASEMGDGEASRRLGAMMERGEGGAVDVEAARRLYGRAVEQGDRTAQAELRRLGG